MPVHSSSWGDTLCCSVCTSPFSCNRHLPVSFSCGHAVCTKCLHKLSAHSCPIDEIPIAVPLSRLPINLPIVRILQNHEPDFEEEGVVSGLCPYYDSRRADLKDLLGQEDFELFELIYGVLNDLSGYLRRNPVERGAGIWSATLSRSMQRKLLSILMQGLVDAPTDGRARASRAIRTAGERCVVEILAIQQNPSHLTANLWSAVRARGCQFLGPAMQEEVLKLILLTLAQGALISRKVLVMYVVQSLEKQYPQASKTSVGHVVQLLYRASCFNVFKRDGESSLMQLKEEFRAYEALRREHDAQLVQIAQEAGLRIPPDQWSALLYGDQNFRSHMQSIIDKTQTAASFGQAIRDLQILMQRSHDSLGLDAAIADFEALAAVDPVAPDDDSACPSWLELYGYLKNLKAVMRAQHDFAARRASQRQNYQGQQDRYHGFSSRGNYYDGSGGGGGGGQHRYNNPAPRFAAQQQNRAYYQDYGDGDAGNQMEEQQQRSSSRSAHNETLHGDELAPLRRGGGFPPELPPRSGGFPPELPPRSGVFPPELPPREPGPPSSIFGRSDLMPKAASDSISTSNANASNYIPEEPTSSAPASCLVRPPSAAVMRPYPVGGSVTNVAYGPTPVMHPPTLRMAPAVAQQETPILPRPPEAGVPLPPTRVPPPPMQLQAGQPVPAATLTIDPNTGQVFHAVPPPAPDLPAVADPVHAGLVAARVPPPPPPTAPPAAAAALVMQPDGSIATLTMGPPMPSIVSAAVFHPPTSHPAVAAGIELQFHQEAVERQHQVAILEKKRDDIIRRLERLQSRRASDLCDGGGEEDDYYRNMSHSVASSVLEAWNTAEIIGTNAGIYLPSVTSAIPKRVALNLRMPPLSQMFPTSGHYQQRVDDLKHLSVDLLQWELRELPLSSVRARLVREELERRGVRQGAGVCGSTQDWTASGSGSRDDDRWDAVELAAAPSACPQPIGIQRSTHCAAPTVNRSNVTPTQAWMSTEATSTYNHMTRVKDAIGAFPLATPVVQPPKDIESSRDAVDPACIVPYLSPVVKSNFGTVNREGGTQSDLLWRLDKTIEISEKLHMLPSLDNPFHSSTIEKRQLRLDLDALERDMAKMNSKKKESTLKEELENVKHDLKYLKGEES